MIGIPSNIVKLMAAMCINAPSPVDCSHDMQICFINLREPVVLCEKKYPDGMNEDSVFTDMACTQLFHEWAGRPLEDYARECKTYVIDWQTQNSAQQEPRS